MYIIKISSFLLVLTLSACSNNKKPKPEAKVITHITEDGIKRFQVVLAKQGKKPQKNKNKGRGQRSRAEGNDSSGNSRSRNSKKSNQPYQLHKRIEHILKRDGYCREGFAEIDRYSEAGTVYFNGQCNELASAEDRLKYINQ